MEEKMKTASFFLIFVLFAACGDEADMQEDDSLPTNPISHFIPVNIVNKAVPNTESLSDKKAPLGEQDIRPFITYAKPQTFRQEVLRSKHPVLVNFFATWCGPCNYIAPYVNDLSRLYPEIKFVKYNISQDSSSDPNSICNIYNVHGVPTFDFFYLGKEYTNYRFSGANVKMLVDNITMFLHDVMTEAQNENQGIEALDSPRIEGDFCPL